MADASDARQKINAQNKEVAGYAEASDKTQALADKTSAEGLQDVDFSSEMESLDLSKIMGGPLIAAIKGLEKACRNTMNFIDTVCFDSEKEPVMVDFELSRPGGILNMGESKQVIQVPFITMVPIPHLRLSKVRVEFNVKLNSVRTTNIGATDNATVISSYGYENENTKEYTKTTDKKNARGGIFSSAEDGPTVESSKSASLMGITSVKRENKVGATVSKDYSLTVIVQAVQDELPRGIEKILDILENEVSVGAEDSAMQQQFLNNALSGLSGGGATGPAGGATGSATGGAPTGGAV